MIIHETIPASRLAITGHIDSASSWSIMDIKKVIFNGKMISTEHHDGNVRIFTLIFQQRRVWINMNIDFTRLFEVFGEPFLLVYTEITRIAFEFV